jgi:hypothetical protein
MGTRVGLIFFLSAAVPLNFLRVQNLTAVRPRGSPSVVTANGMHQDATNRMRSQATGLVTAAVDALGYADRFGLLPLIAELRRVVQYEDRSIGRDHPIVRRLEMTGQDVRFPDPVVREKPIGRLGICPILADQRNALSYGAPDLRQEFAQPLGQTIVGKATAGKLTISPRLN